MERRFGHRYVFGNIDHDRSWPTCGGDKECLLQRHRQVGHVLDQEIVLDAGTRDADRIAFLKRILPNRVSRYLPGDDDHRDGIHIGGSDTGDRIGHAGSGGHQGHAGPAGCTRIGIGSMNSSLFMTYENVLEAFLLVNFVVDDQHGAAGIAEYEFNVFGLERTTKYFSARKGLMGSGSL